MTPLVGVILPPWAGLGNPGHLTVKPFMTLDLSAFLIVTAVLVDVDNSNFVIIALDTICFDVGAVEVLGATPLQAALREWRWFVGILRLATQKTVGENDNLAVILKLTRQKRSFGAGFCFG